jgi:hypothetical protein
MSAYNAQLLCTFAKYATYQNDIDALCRYYTIVEKKIYVLQSGLSKDDVFLTYNAEKNNSQFYPNTISVHRKKEYNIIYSINALNELIKEQNNGVISNTFQINWEEYRNSFITARDGKVKITPTKLIKIFQIT